ncbi:MAG: ATP-dependent helicase [Candidatus Microsaccharimonas sossegonensis]|uniref:DNA 3'-5' helicase n=1 Tax=Candidatus Microsaccharimonas sossegonensis TaxID=2506948 RepID=A0A4Q0AHK5_9BACT|nr:MAG: ATP-dependent helicase [Candidatus Microsaccharimonas sossegonensis]
MDFEKRYQQLNAAQKQAVDLIEGPVMVIAGPGTGKTELLSVRTAHILKKTDTLPENILCLTFTESGATAMRERLVGIIGKDAYKVSIHTFHSFGTEVINQNREFFYRGASFEPADDINRYEILRSIFDELDYKNPLASTMNGEYTHQPDTTKIISELKRSGLNSDELLAVLDENEAAIDFAERIIVPHISGSVNKTTKEKLASILPELRLRAETTQTLYEVTPLIRAIVDGLASTLEQAEIDHPTKPITAWKKKWFVKNEKAAYIFRSRAYIVKFRALVFVYYEYLKKMEEKGLYDYDDMILQVVRAMEDHDDLRYNLQEKYLYIMVDEFQDTNLAQTRILRNLTSNPVNEGRPNLMIVGDDDQAIYSFQGAEISNILEFQTSYPAVQKIVLTDNYRSGDAIIAQGRAVIVQGNDRLENRYKDIDKRLTGHRGVNGLVELYEAKTIDHERQWIVESVAKEIKSGTLPQNIAVLTRQHKEIQSLLPYFHHAGIAVSYERQENVLDQAPIIVLEKLASVIIAISKGHHDEVNALLPELLAHPAWGISPHELWQLSIKAYSTRQHWMEVMATTPGFIDIHSWLIELAALSPFTALEPMIDRIIGRVEDTTIAAKNSPFFDYFFGPEQLAANPSQYLDFLAALRTIRSKLRDYHSQESLTLASYLTFVTLHRRIGTELKVSHGSETNSNAVNLMTVHKSKGLEFEVIYIFNAVDNVWGEKARGGSRNVNYPENLLLAVVGDSIDERLRLFYVAMTRAKTTLRMSFSHSDDKDKQTLLASFLTDTALDPIAIAPAGNEAQLASAELAWYQPLAVPRADLMTLLQPSLEHYKLSATHLNSFLDVTHGGPQKFLIDHILHFPATKSPAASFGTAVHATLQQAHVHLVATGEKKPLEDILHDFEINLTKERLNPLDYTTYVQKGSEQLQTFLTEKYDTFTATQKSELNFSGQEVYLDEAHLTGKIDIADINVADKTMIVTDYKTGKAVSSWSAVAEYDKIKLHKYRQQLLFYKLLVEHSRDYHGYTVTEGCLEFVEPNRSNEIASLRLNFDQSELDRFATLVGKVWQHIIELDLPDTSMYESSYKGLLEFEQDLLDGTI